MAAPAPFEVAAAAVVCSRLVGAGAPARVAVVAENTSSAAMLPVTTSCTLPCHPLAVPHPHNPQTTITQQTILEREWVKMFPTARGPDSMLVL